MTLTFTIGQFTVTITVEQKLIQELLQSITVKSG
jgi:hypothetical protein